MKRLTLLIILLACMSIAQAGGPEWREQDGLFALFAEDGTQLTEYRYTGAYPFIHGIANVRLRQSIGLVNEQGKELVRPIYGSAPYCFGDAQFCLYRTSDNPVWLSWVAHPKLSSTWIDATGKVYIQGTKNTFFVGDVIPEVLWDY